MDTPSSFPQFRPIALCFVIYKLITKTIANMLKPLMPHIVSPTQSSFVPGWHITDKIVMALEAIHSMRQMKGKRGCMTIKVDLEKAYDSISWKFLFVAFMMQVGTLN